MMNRFRIFLMAALLLVVLSSGGCGLARTTSPKTYSVTGTVRYKGGELMKGGAIQLQSTTDSPFTIRGTIKEDGTFTLETFLEGGRKKPGAIPGEYRVMIVPPQDKDQRFEEVRTVQPLWTVEPREDNRFEIEVEKMPPSR